MKKYNKEVLTSYEKYIDDEDFKVLICDGGNYYDVHIISERYRDDELNTLKLQEPKECIDNFDAYFDKKYMIGRLMEHFIWDRFYNEGVLSLYVEIKEIEEH